MVYYDMGSDYPPLYGNCHQIIDEYAKFAQDIPGEAHVAQTNRVHQLHFFAYVYLPRPFAKGE
jgi:hypothetical protein